MGRLVQIWYYSFLWTCMHGKSVLFFFADDAGLEGGIFGNPVIRTPHLDELGRKSVRFTRAFTPVSSCSPSRAAVLTGLPVHQNGMYGLHHNVHHFDSFDKVQSLPLILGNNNIKTGIIGKKHVGPNGVFPFDFAHTEENSPINQVGRNITHIKNLVGSFLDKFGDEPFFLYIPFHDPHRCGHTNPELGEFCQKFGDSVSGFGTIPDWEPTYYSDEEVIVPGTVPDTQATRSEIANQYTTISRLDQGIGLIMDELTARGHINETLVIYSSDNGIPFPNGRTNFYDLGIHQPLLISSPVHPKSHGQSIASLVSLLDVTPTILDWFRISYPRYKMFHHSPSVRLTGKSLLPALDSMSKGQTDLTHQERAAVFGSHNLHEVTMYYPMRYIRSPRFKLIRNLAHESYFPIDQDFFLSKSLQDLLLRFRHKKDLRWIKTWPQYLIRPQWELFDLESDPLEIHNLAVDSKFQAILKDLQYQLTAWLNVTQDPWICGPNQVLEDKGSFKDNPQCFSYLF